MIELADIADHDAAAVKNAQGGDTDAFESLVAKYENKVYAVALRMTGNSEDAKDAVQEVFLKVYRSLALFRGESKFSTWLYRVTHNVCMDFLRRGRRRETALEPVGDTDDGSARIAEMQSDADVEREVENAEFKTLVGKAIDKLPIKYKKIIVLRDMQDLSYTEISEILGLPEGTVKSRLNRARNSLRRIFLSYGELKGYI